MITENLLQKKINITNVSNRYVDIACTSATVRMEKLRYELFDIIQKDSQRFNYEELLSIDLKLKKTLMHNFDYHYFLNLNFGAELCFNNTYVFSNCTFTNCTFSGCVISTANFVECKFYDCYFYEVQLECNTDKNTRLIFGGCHGHEEFAILSAKEITAQEQNDNEKIILEYFWSGSRYSRGKVHHQNIMKNHSEEEKAKMSITLENLRKEQVLYKEGQFWALNMVKIKEIRGKLGR